MGHDKRKRQHNHRQREELRRIDRALNLLISARQALMSAPWQHYQVIKSLDELIKQIEVEEAIKRIEAEYGEE